MRLAITVAAVLLTPIVAFAGYEPPEPGPPPEPACLGSSHAVQANTVTFTPGTVNIDVGESVCVHNPSGIQHNFVSDDSASFRCANGCDGQGGDGDPAENHWVASLTYSNPGTYRYHCQIHGPSMSFTVNVEGGAAAPGSLSFSTASQSVGEGAGNVTVTARRTGGDDGAISVQYATSPGSASAADYTPKTGTLNWADNDDANKTFTVAITNDATDENNESFTVALSNPSGGASLASPSTQTVTITDNDDGGGGGGNSGTLSFSQASFSTDEGTGPAAIVVERNGGTSGAVSVSYAASSSGAGGTGSPNNDFTPVTGTLNWANGDGADKTFNVPVLDDGFVEGDETIALALTSPGGGAALGTAAATLTVGDDESAPAGPCVPNATTLCFANNRFRLELDWRFANGQSGQGQAVPLTGNAGAFYFVNAGNLEMLVKVLNACALNDRYWVFFAATTDVEFNLTVTDTQAGRTKSYFNPLGRAAPPIQDTSAFATCP